MMGVVFKPVEISPDLSLAIYRSTLIIFMIVVVVFYIRSLVKFIKVEKSDQQLRKLKREWSENGNAVLNWLKVHNKELELNIEGTISNPEFQKMLWKDFEIYDKLIILCPELREDQIANEGRDFYRLLIRTKSQRPS